MEHPQLLTGYACLVGDVPTATCLVGDVHTATATRVFMERCNYLLLRQLQIS